MPERKVEIVAVIDMTGSMEPRRQDAVGGFNAFVREQKKLKGDCAVTALFFNSEKYETWLDAVELSRVPKLGKEYVPAGMTPLLDAVGRTIDAVEKRLKKTAARKRPDKVVFVVITDGEENSSEKYTFKKVAEKIGKLRRQGSWEFLFLGADLDSFRQGRALGIPCTLNYMNDVRGAYASLSAAVCGVRSGKPPKLPKV